MAQRQNCPVITLESLSTMAILSRVGASLYIPKKFSFSGSPPRMINLSGENSMA
ncbi:hypothetical protein GFS31_40140 [Leptolyngbya sp. BL0902]|nr:hypothetical protein GFS31_40140 [Leptolyngbya sp. BL0902]